MNKIILLLLAMTISLSTYANQLPNYTYQTYQPYQTYQSIPPAQAAQPIDYIVQPYGQQYNQGYYQTPYQSQCQGQYVTPYQGYNSYGNNAPYTVMNPTAAGLAAPCGTQQIVRNIGQSLLYSMLRGR